VIRPFSAIERLVNRVCDGPTESQEPLEDPMSRSRRFDTDTLVSALSDAKDTKADQARDLFHSAADVLSDGSRTARKRVNRAVDALAGRPAPSRWGQLTLFAAIGVVFGAIAALFGRKVVSDRLAEIESKPDELEALQRARAEATMVP
jgi:hypothetical protein